MAVRTTMADIVLTLRQYGSAGISDEFAGVVYWTDQQLQDIADENGRRGAIKAKSVDPLNKIFRLVAPDGVEFENDLDVYTTQNVLLEEVFTYNRLTEEVIFTNAQSVSEVLVRGLLVNTNDALAQLWQAKADMRFDYIDWKAQNNRMNMKQEYDHCVERARYYRNKKVRTFDRKGRGTWYYA